MGLTPQDVFQMPTNSEDPGSLLLLLLCILAGFLLGHEVLDRCMSPSVHYLAHMKPHANLPAHALSMFQYPHRMQLLNLIHPALDLLEAKWELPPGPEQDRVSEAVATVSSHNPSVPR